MSSLTGRRQSAAIGWRAQLFSLLRSEVVLIAIILLGVALRFYALGAESLWVDEGTSISVARLSLPQIFADRIYKNPPFYFILLHFWIQIFGDSEVALRFLSALFGALALGAMYLVGRKLLGREGGLISTFLLAISLFHVAFSQEARAYSLMVLLVLVSMWLFLRLLEKPDRLTTTGYVLSNVLLLYTHFYGVFFVAVQNLFWLYLFWRQRQQVAPRLGQWVAIQGAILLLFAPWLRYLLLEVRSMQTTGVWIAEPTAVTLWEIFFGYASDSVLLLLLFAGLGGWWLLYGRSPSPQPENEWQTDTAVAMLLLLWLGVPILVPFIASHLLAPLLIPRYTIAASLAFYLLVAVALLRLRWSSLRIGLLLFIALASLLGLSRYYGQIDKQQWREVAALIEQEGQAGDALLFHPGGLKDSAFGYYYQRDDMVQIPFDLSTDIATSFTGQYEAKQLDNLAQEVAGFERVWLIQANNEVADGSLPEALASLYARSGQFPFFGVTLGLYANASVPNPELIAGPTVVQQVRYRLPEAGEVNLVWGVDAWQTLPALSQMMETAVQNNLMVTPMQRDGDSFVAELLLPEAAQLDYVFQVTANQQQVPVDLWDTRSGQDYQIAAAQGEPVTQETSFSAAERDRLNSLSLTMQEIRYELPEATAVNLVWGVNGWQSVPAAIWPAGTVQADNLQFTPMVREGDLFVASVPVAAGGQLDYAFQTFIPVGQQEVEEWDTNQQSDYQLVAEQSGAVEIRPSASLFGYRLLARQQGREWLMLLGVGVLLVVGGYFTQRQVRRWDRLAFFNSRQWLHLRDLMRVMVTRDIKLRYKGSFLGILWSLLNPFVQLLVFSFVFQALLPLDIPNYPAYLFSGLLAWGWFNAALMSSATVILEGRDLIRRPGFPPIVLPVVTVASNLVHFLLSLPILLLFLLFTQIVLQPTLFWLPVIICLQFVFTLSLAYFVATFHVMFRDTQHLVNIFLLLLFYLTPIFYDASQFSSQIQWLFHLNPLLILLDAYRAILIYGQPPDFLALGLLLVLSVALLAVGYRLFLQTSYRFVEEL
ncbi:MAG: ABC transporter permease [Ardenticatenaceae bacterium]|nr:ABC transporter permease [Ardenticatenaceae bacterium]